MVTRTVTITFLFLLTIVSVMATSEVEVYTYDSYYDAANHHSTYSEKTSESYIRTNLGNGYYDAAYGGHEYFYEDEHDWDNNKRRDRRYNRPLYYRDQESYSYTHEVAIENSHPYTNHYNAQRYNEVTDVHPSEYPTRVAAYAHHYDAQEDAYNRGYDYPHNQRNINSNNIRYNPRANIEYQESENYLYLREGRYTSLSEEYNRYEHFDSDRTGSSYYGYENYDYSKNTLRHTGYKGGYCDRGSYGTHSNPGGGYYHGYERRC